MFITYLYYLIFSNNSQIPNNSNNSQNNNKGNNRNLDTKNKISMELWETSFCKPSAYKNINSNSMNNI